jgi:hypothetical protein
VANEELVVVASGILGALSATLEKASERWDEAPALYAAGSVQRKMSMNGCKSLLIQPERPHYVL